MRNNHLFVRSVSCLFVWLVSWLFIWLVGCLIVCLVGWFVSRIIQKLLRGFPRNMDGRPELKGTVGPWWSSHATRVQGFIFRFLLLSDQLSKTQRYSL